MILLENYINKYIIILTEKIRSSSVFSSEKFSINQFKKLAETGDEKPLLEYAENFLEKIGTGSSREVFVLTSKTALKIALSEAGRAQNVNEVKLQKSRKIDTTLFAKIYSYDKIKFNYVIAELVRPLTSEDEFATSTGIDFDYLDQLFYYEEYIRLGRKSGYFNLPDLLDLKGKNKFFNSIWNASIGEKRLMAGDLASIEQWGKTSEGRVVLLDYGLSETTFKTFYKNS